MLILLLSSYTTCLIFLLLSSCLGVDSGKHGEGAGSGSDQRSTRGTGRGGAASLGGGAEGGGAGGAVSPHPESSLEPGFGESVANTLQPGAHADAHSRRAAGGERHFCQEGGGKR